MHDAITCRSVDVAVHRYYIGAREVARIRPVDLFSDTDDVCLQVLVRIPGSDEFIEREFPYDFESWDDALYFLRVQLYAHYKKEIAERDYDPDGWLKSQPPALPFEPRSFADDLSNDKPWTSPMTAKELEKAILTRAECLGIRFVDTDETRHGLLAMFGDDRLALIRLVPGAEPHTTNRQVVLYDQEDTAGDVQHELDMRGRLNSMHLVLEWFIRECDWDDSLLDGAVNDGTCSLFYRGAE